MGLTDVVATVTGENLGLVFHPFNRPLRPARMLLA